MEPLTAPATPGLVRICSVAELPRLGARVYRAALGDIAIFRTAEDHVHALLDRCPHKGGPLSQGIVFGASVACPLHGWTIDLTSGMAAAPDVGCTARFRVSIVQDEVWLALTEQAACELGERVESGA